MVLYVNPGSAGPRRLSLPNAVGRLLIDGEAVSAELMKLDPKSRQPPVAATAHIGRWRPGLDR